MKDLAEVKANADVDAHSDAANEAAEQCPVGVIQVLS